MQRMIKCGLVDENSITRDGEDDEYDGHLHHHEDYDDEEEEYDRREREERAEEPQTVNEEHLYTGERTDTGGEQQARVHMDVNE
jgi:hypothetical protein